VRHPAASNDNAKPEDKAQENFTDPDSRTFCRPNS
jgi:hypothetical protein